MFNLRVIVAISLLFWLPVSMASLPDFTELVEDVSPSVVKINTVSLSEQRSSQQLPDIFRDLFEYGGGRPHLRARCDLLVRVLLSLKMAIF